MLRTFAQKEQLIRQFAERNSAMPVEHILLIRLLMHLDSSYLEQRNKLLKEFQINETLFMALLALYFLPEQELQPSKLSSFLGSSRTNATRISDELVARKWAERISSEQDRRCYFLRLTDSGKAFLEIMLPNQWQHLDSFFSVLENAEKAELIRLLKKLSTRIETMQEQSEEK